MNIIKYLLLIVLIFYRTICFSQIDFLNDALKGTNDRAFGITSSFINYSDSIVLKSDDYTGIMEAGIEYLTTANYLKATNYFKSAKTLYTNALENYQPATFNGILDKNPYPDYYLGICYVNLAEFDSAIFHFESALKEVPFFIDALNSLGNTYLQMDSIDKALEVFQNGLDINNDLDILIHNTAYCNYLKNESKKAKEALEHNIRSNPNFITSYFLLGYMEEQSGNLDRADEIYSSAVNQNPENMETIYARAYFHLRNNNLKSAKIDFNAIKELNPQDTTSIALTCLLTLHEGEYAKGITDLSKLLSNSKGFIQQQQKTELQYFDLELGSILLGLVENANKDELSLVGYLFDEIIFARSSTKSIDQAKILLQSHPNSIIGKRVLLYSEIAHDPSNFNRELIEEILKEGDYPTIMYLKAKFLFDNKQYSSSIEEFQQLLKISPQYGFPHNYIGRCYAKIGQHDLAIVAYTRAIKLMPNSPKLYLNRGNSYEFFNESRKAINDYKKTLSISTLNGWPYNNMGLSYRSLKLYDSAIYCFNKALEINNYESPHYNMGLLYEDLEQYDKAVKQYTKAIGLNKMQSIYYNKRGNMYNVMGHIDEALKDYNMCIKLNPHNPNYYRDRGNAYLYIENYENAIVDFLKATEIAPNYSYGYRRLGDACRNALKYDMAIKYYRKALSTRSSYTDKNNYAGHDYGEFELANTYLYVRKLDSAIMHFKRAIEVSPEHSAAYGMMGWAYYLLGDYDSCIENSEKAVEYDEEAFYARFNIALSTLCKGEFEKAEALYEQYVNLAVAKKRNIKGAKADLEKLVKKKFFRKEAKKIQKKYF